jgi:hypothetical protein
MPMEVQNLGWASLKNTARLNRLIGSHTVWFWIIGCSMIQSPTWTFTTTNLAVCCSLRLYNILIGSSIVINKPPPRYNYLFSFETSLEQSINPLFLLFLILDNWMFNDTITDLSKTNWQL